MNQDAIMHSHCDDYDVKDYTMDLEMDYPDPNTPSKSLSLWFSGLEIAGTVITCGCFRYYF